MTYQVVKSFQDLDVYQRLYQAMIQIHKQILFVLPLYEKFGLVDQMRRASKAPPALIAEGFAKRHHKRYWNKYLQDSIGECNEMINHLSVCRDLYGDKVNLLLCDQLIEEYTISCKQLHRLISTWKNFDRP